jgi:hypothetical protein
MTIVWLFTLIVGSAVDAASAFANPAFQTQWQQGEALTPNFWGPLANAKDGTQEPYKEAQGSSRLVQYFDKGRMELTNGAVTNGLLASELVTGRIQTGDSTFEDHAQPAIPVAGDPNTSGATYADFAGEFRLLLDPFQSHIGGFLDFARTPQGRLTFYTPAGPDNTNMDSSKIPNDLLQPLASYDAVTQHNVFAPFGTYRNLVGFATIGLAISEPFFSQVTVAGNLRVIAIQVFERRLLTYTPTNPAGFQVEMGNVGQHYYQWRYSGTQAAASPTPPASGVKFIGAGPAPDNSALMLRVQTAPNAACMYSYGDPTPGAASTATQTGAADANGIFSFSVPVASKADIVKITYSCDGASETKFMTIGR